MIMETATAIIYCLTIDLLRWVWYENSNPVKIALIPFAIKKIESKKVKESNPPLGLLAISKNISSNNSEVVGGSSESINTRNCSWKSSIKLIYGIRLRINIRKGKMAMKKLNAMALALVEKVPCIIPPE
jgi:hypothetical protein